MKTRPIALTFMETEILASAVARLREELLETVRLNPNMADASEPYLEAYEQLGHKLSALNHQPWEA